MLCVTCVAKEVVVDQHTDTIITIIIITTITLIPMDILIPMVVVVEVEDLVVLQIN